jgi:hypothetical protein
VEDDKRQATEPVDTVNVANFCRRAGGVIVGIEPLNKRRSYQILA